MDEPCTLSTPNFDSLPSYQVLGSYRTSQYTEGISRLCDMNFILELKTVFYERTQRMSKMLFLTRENSHLQATCNFVLSSFIAQRYKKYYIVAYLPGSWREQSKAT